jgi:hypothetical protein
MDGKTKSWDGRVGTDTVVCKRHPPTKIDAREQSRDGVKYESLLTVIRYRSGRRLHHNSNLPTLSFHTTHNTTSPLGCLVHSLVSFFSFFRVSLVATSRRLAFTNPLLLMGACPRPFPVIRGPLIFPPAIYLLARHPSHHLRTSTHTEGFRPLRSYLCFSVPFPLPLPRLAHIWGRSSVIFISYLLIVAFMNKRGPLPMSPPFLLSPFP